MLEEGMRETLVLLEVHVADKQNWAGVQAAVAFAHAKRRLSKRAYCSIQRRI